MKKREKISWKEIVLVRLISGTFLELIPNTIFLIAALKCRQRKKQWFSNLRARVEYLTNDNDHLQMETDTLRKEIMDLNTLLVAHKDCPQYNAALSASSMHQQQHHQLQHPSLYHSSLRF
jgi:hypothetical protein